MKYLVGGAVRSLDRIVETATGLRRYSGRLLKQTNNLNGYPTISLRASCKGRTTKVHLLVTEAFLRRVNGKDFINHIDGNKENNSKWNLERCTTLENKVQV